MVWIIHMVTRISKIPAPFTHQRGLEALRYFYFHKLTKNRLKTLEFVFSQPLNKTHKYLMKHSKDIVWNTVLIVLNKIFEYFCGQFAIVLIVVSTRRQ